MKQFIKSFFFFAIIMALSFFANAQGSGIINLTGTQDAAYLNTSPLYASISVTSSVAKNAYNPTTGKHFKYDNTQAAGSKWIEYGASGGSYTWSTTAPALNVGNLVLKYAGTATSTQTTITSSNGIALTGTADNWSLAYDPATVTVTSTSIPFFRSVEDATVSAGRQWRASSDNTMGVAVGTMYIKSPILMFLNRYRLAVLHRFQHLL